VDDNKSKIKPNNPNSLLLTEWDNLKRLMWSENCVVSPNKFIRVIQDVARVKKLELFTGYSQNDVPEFLLFLIDCFHNSLSREVNIIIEGDVVNETDKLALECYKMIQHSYSKDYSEIWNIFYGIHVSQIISLETNEMLSMKSEPFFIIDLSIPSLVGYSLPITLYDCLNLYVDGEVLEGDNAWFNEDLKRKQNVQKKIMYWSFPNILVIAIKRFNCYQQKNSTLIDFPIDNLNLSKYVINYEKRIFKEGEHLYNLYGICNHVGNTNGGHYTSYVKNANGKWYEFNDTHVNRIKENNLITPSAYVLFYRKSVK
jgi:ubiquitin carboxyl-terminal hydrolase 8